LMRDNLLIPTTVGLVSGAPHSDDAKLLIDFLLSKQRDQKLVDLRFALMSVRNDISSSHFGSPLVPMDVDYRAVAKKMPDAVRRATAILEGRQ